MNDHTPRIHPLDRVDCPEAGGKALGLARLARLGLPVPAGFVIVGARPGCLPEALDAAYEELGAGRVAVRSSALGEDGAAASFAGQFDSVLEVEGPDALRHAVERCLGSLHNDRAEAYATGRGNGNGRAMSVVVQRMVAARAAGVLFTADPVTTVRERVVVDAVAGLGEALVAGHATADQFVLTRDGRVERRTLAGDRPVVTDDELGGLVDDALRAEAGFGTPLDMEWALDGEGRRYWLQARPITTLDEELEDVVRLHRPTDVFTNANIGEMMPGAVNPLTVTTTFWAVDQGMQEMQVRYGALPERKDGFYIATVFYGHLFMDLSSMAEAGRLVAGQTPDTLSLAICGRRVPELTVGPRGPLPLRAWNAAKYVRYVLGGPADIERFAPRVARFRIELGATMDESYRAIDAAREHLFEVVHMHLRSSAGSGALIGVIEGILTRGKAPTPEDQSALISALANAGGVESAELVRDLDRVVEVFAQDEGSWPHLCDHPAEHALHWLRGPGSGDGGGAFEEFLRRHGHRAFREADLRQPSWADDPLPLVESIRCRVEAARAGHRRTVPETTDPYAGLEGRVPRWLVRYARSTVRNRERTKSMMIATLDELKRAFRHLGGRLVEAGRLPELDLLYFLTHREIGLLVRGPDEGLVAKARRRRRVHELQGALRFADLSLGPPVPEDPSEGVDPTDGTLQGRPASHGVAEGVARVARDAEEAASVRPGEILIAPVTDVGWTPYFGIIAGLATDVGSPISHGAVVAREYGLPAVVNLRTATRTFRTGDRVVLDGTRGTLRRAE